MKIEGLVGLPDPMHNSAHELAKKYNLVKGDTLILDKVKDFIKTNSETLKTLKTYIKFVEECPFPIDTPFKGPDGKNYLVKSISTSCLEGVRHWTTLEGTSSNGEVKRFDIKELLEVNSKQVG